MSRRSVDWNQGLAAQLRNRRFAGAFIQAALDEGLPLQSVLAKVIRLYGVKEFAAVVKLPSSNLLRALRPGHNPTLGTLTKLLEPFGLEINIGPVRKKAAA